uniref:Metaxin n=1 Tax=Ciona savignyi TaxID=51511 RepID=H2YU04_CIOSA
MAQPEVNTNQPASNEDSHGKMKLKCWGGGYGLPSLDPDCLSVITYAGIVNAPLNLVPALPNNSVTGSLPELQIGDFIYQRAFTIIGVFRREGYNADQLLTEVQKADTLAFLSYIDQKLKPAVLYNLWVDARNFNAVTQPATGKACGFPLSLWYPAKIRKTISSYIWFCKGAKEYTSMKDIERMIYKDGYDSLNILNSKLSNSDFFFGDYPTTLDAVLFGHLVVLKNSPLVSTELQNHLNSCENLIHFCDRMAKFCPSTAPPQKKQVTSNLFSKEQVVSLMVCAGAMIFYAFTSGVLTEERSKLAAKLRTSQFNESDPMD